jgi:coenzyme F420-reducing hydrogenase alpha subunit
MNLQQPPWATSGIEKEYTQTRAPTKEKWAIADEAGREEIRMFLGKLYHDYNPKNVYGEYYSIFMSDMKLPTGPISRKYIIPNVLLNKYEEIARKEAKRFKELTNEEKQSMYAHIIRSLYISQVQVYTLIYSTI